jgi:hypothetical protein
MIAHVEENLGQSLIVQFTPALWECLWQSLLRWLSNPLTMDCSRGDLNETASCCAIFICTSRMSVTGPTTGLSNLCLNTHPLLCLDKGCSCGGKLESHCAIYACTLRVSVTFLVKAAVQSSDNGLLTGWIEWDSFLLCNFHLHFKIVCEGAQGRMVKRKMNAHYADARLLMPTTWIGSYILWASQS